MGEELKRKHCAETGAGEYCDEIGMDTPQVAAEAHETLAIQEAMAEAHETLATQETTSKALETLAIQEAMAYHMRLEEDHEREEDQKREEEREKEWEAHR